MINAEKRKAIYLLHTEGMGLREISRKLKVGCNSVSRIIAQQGEMPEIKRRVGNRYKKCQDHFEEAVDAAGTG